MSNWNEVYHLKLLSTIIGIDNTLDKIKVGKNRLFYSIPMMDVTRFPHLYFKATTFFGPMAMPYNY
jgi:hypothetical protein